MATESSKNSSKEKTQAKRATTEVKHAADEAAGAAGDAAKAGKRAAAKTAVAEKGQVQVVAEAAVDLPVGVVLTVSDRVSDLVEPWTGRGTAEKQIKAYRTQLRKTIKRTERRGSSARRRATTEARKTRNRVEREARKHQRSVESRVRQTLNEQTTRAQSLVDTVTDQFASLR